MKQKGLFLDRDGVICKATPRGVYVLSGDDFVLLEGIRELIIAARSKKYHVAVITNQPQVGKGLLSSEGLADIHAKMERELGKGMLDAIYVCPHRNDEGCECRKPKPGMLLRAADELQLDLPGSLFLGDSDKDVQAGRAAGVRTIFIKNEFNAQELARSVPDIVVEKPQDVIGYLS